MAAAIPTLADPASRQVVHAIVDPLGYYRRCFRALSMASGSRPTAP